MLLHPLGAPGESGATDSVGLNFQMLSPLPDQRRDSHTEFEFPVNIPVPSEFADLSRKSSMVDGTFAHDKSAISLEGIEVRIQSSTDNLMDVCEDEPYMFEEKPIEERRESLPSLLDKSFTIDEDVEHSETKSEIEDRDQLEDSGSAAGESDEHDEVQEEEQKEKTEGQESDEADETVKETWTGDCALGENGEDNSTPEADSSALDETSREVEGEAHGTTQKEEADVLSIKEKEVEETNLTKEDASTQEEEEEEKEKEKQTEEAAEACLIKSDEEVEAVSVVEEEQEVSLRREEPMGEDAAIEPSTQEVPLAEEEVPDIQEEELEAAMDISSGPPMERIVEGAEAVTEDEMEEEEKGENYE